MYGFNIILKDGFDNVVRRVTEALKKEVRGRFERVRDKLAGS